MRLAVVHINFRHWLYIKTLTPIAVAVLLCAIALIAHISSDIDLQVRLWLRRGVPL